MVLKIKKIFGENISGQSASVRGWIKSLRKSKKFSFVVLNDGSSQKDLQIVVDQEMNGYEELTSLGTGACVELTGELVQSQGKNQSIEMQAKEYKIFGHQGEDYPLQKKATSLEFLREIAHLRPRSNTFGAVFRVRHILAQATHEFFSNEGLYYLNTPIITACDAEGAGDMFRVSTLPAQDAPTNDKGAVDFSEDYYGQETFLTVTGQLQAEAFALGMGGVYTFGPTFRSEKSNTSRHLAEFWMIEPEVAFYELADIADMGARYIQFMIKKALKHCPDEISFLESRYEKGLTEKLNNVMNSDFKQITYTEAIEILEKSGQKFEFKPEWGADLQTEHERFLTEEHFNGPVIVTDYPKSIKAFYMKQNEDGKTVKAMDILVPGVGEIIGGSQREDDLEKLKKRMNEMKLNEKDYWWYLELRKFGGCPHAGFGLGFERAVMYITGMSNIRDVIPFPRYYKHATF